MRLWSLLFRLSLAVAAGPAAAQPDPATLTDADLLALLDEVDRRLAPVGRIAGYGIPSGFGLPRGLVFAAVSGTNKSMRSRPGVLDGSLAFGIGLGDARTAISVTPVVVVTSVSPEDFGDSGTVGLSLHREFPSRVGPVALALGLENLARWGDSAPIEPGGYVAASAILDVGRPMLATVGYGSHIADLGRDPGLFAGMALGVGRNVSVSLSWAGDEAIGGLTLWPEPTGRVQVTLGAGDLTNRVGGRRLLFSISYAR